MKPKKQIRRGLPGRSSQWLGLCSVTLCFLSAGQAMAQSTWTGGTSTAWNDSGNWTGGIPAANAVLNFGGEPANMPTNNDLAGLTTGAINFTNNGFDIAVVTPTAGTGDVSFTLGTLPQSITLGGDINATSIASGGTVLNDTINLNLTLNATRTVNCNNQHSVTINGIISGDFSLNKGGTGNSGTLFLNGANTYTGVTNINTGGILISNIADTVSSNIGLANSIRIGNQSSTGTFSYTGAGATTARTVTIGSPSTGNATHTGGATINSNGTAGTGGLIFSAPTFNNPVTLSVAGTTTRNLTLSGSNNTDINEIQGTIQNGGTTTGTVLTSLTKDGDSIWKFSGNNTYTGPTFINKSTLNVTKIADSGESSIGFGTSLRMGNGVDTGTLTYTGSAASATSRQIQLGNGIVNNSNGGGAIRNNGDGILEFTNTAFNIPVATGIGNSTNITTRTLVLGGTNIGNNRIAGVIANNLEAETPIVALAKQDAGLWILEGVNTYTGTTTVSGGTLSVSKIADSGDSNLGNSGQLTLGGGTLSYSGASAATTARNVVLSADSTIDVASASGSLDISDGTSGAFVLTKTGSGILVLSGSADNNSLLLNATGGEVHLAKDATAGIRAVSGITGIGSGATVKLIGPGTDQIFGGNFANQGVNGIVAGGTLDLNGKSEVVSFLNGTGGVVDGAVVGGSGTVTLTVGLADVTASFGGIIKNTTGTLNLSKTGTGTQTLSGSNTYTGTTAINNGTLTLTGATQATSAITSSGGGKLGLDVGSPVTAANATVTFTGRTVLVTGTPTLASYTLLTASSIVGTPTFAAPAPAGYSLQVADNNKLLLVSDGPVDPFVSWAGSGVDTGFDEDLNKDGVENGLAWLLGAGSPNANATGLLPVVTQTAGSLKLAFDMLPSGARDGAQLFVEHSSNLGISDLWTGVLVLDATGGSAPVTFSVNDVNPGDPLNPLDVEATISNTEATAGKLFGRLRAER